MKLGPWGARRRAAASTEQRATRVGRAQGAIHGSAQEGDNSEEEGEEGEEGGEGEEGAEEERGVGEVRWFVPDGFQVAAEPEKLDNTLIGSTIYMRWETFGWQLGKITDVITEATPRLVKKFNFRLVWADKSKGPASLRVQNYAFGADARLNSWVILEQSEV